MNHFYQKSTYYGGFDPGSGRAGLKVVPANGAHLPADLMTIDSCIATGNADELLARGDINAQIKDVIRDGEALISLQGSDYYLQDLAREGRNMTYALGNPERYWGDHSRVLLLALASQLIPDRSYTLRLVTALPVTLYNKENRARVKDKLSGYYRYQFNGQWREATISVGYVCMEGQGALIHSGLPTGEQSVIDIGERTSDFVCADGQKLIVSQCRGNQDLGVGLITDALDKLLRRHGRVLSTPKLHEIMEQWAAGEAIENIETSTGTLAGATIIATIDKARTQLAKGIVSFASSIWNVEGESVGQRFIRIVAAGGGAHYAGDLLSDMLPHVFIPSDPEDSNLNGYCDLALTLEDKLPNVWVA